MHASGEEAGRPRPSTHGSGAVLGVLQVEAGTGVPLRALVAVARDAAGVLEHPGEVHQVPGHERGVAVGEVVLGPAAAGVEVRRPGSGLTDPAGVRVRRDRVADVLEAVEHVLAQCLMPSSLPVIRQPATRP